MLTNSFSFALTMLGRLGYIVFNVVFILFLRLTLPLLSQEKVKKIAGLWGKACLFFLRTRVEIINPERLILPTGAEAVFATMHTSTLDTFLYTAIMPWKIAYVAKSSLKNHFLLGAAFQRCGHIFVDRSRSGKGALRFLDAVRNLSVGTSLFIHPEGTRIPDGVERKARSGFASAAKERHAAIIPVTSCGGSAIWNAKNWFPTPGTIRIIVHEAWKPEDVEASSLSDLCSRYEKLCQFLPEKT
jgi:1-acyl-sn-glycerol-3-phosphate acyltransferase